MFVAIIMKPSLLSTRQHLWSQFSDRDVWNAVVRELTPLNSPIIARNITDNFVSKQYPLCSRSFSQWTPSLLMTLPTWGVQSTTSWRYRSWIYQISITQSVHEMTSFFQTAEGNLPSSMGWVVSHSGRERKEEDQLIHWCHGAAGVIYLFARYA